MFYLYLGINHVLFSLESCRGTEIATDHEAAPGAPQPTRRGAGSTVLRVWKREKCRSIGRRTQSYIVTRSARSPSPPRYLPSPITGVTTGVPSSFSPGVAPGAPQLNTSTVAGITRKSGLPGHSRSSPFRQEAINPQVLRSLTPATATELSHSPPPDAGIRRVVTGGDEPLPGRRRLLKYPDRHSPTGRR